MKLYKYTKLEYALDILENKRLFLSNPESFNDPFDCDLSLDKEASRKASDLVVNYSNFNETYLALKQIRNRINKNKAEAQIILMYGDELKKACNVFPRYDYWPYIDNFIKRYNFIDQHALEESKKRYVTVINKVMDTIRKKTLIYCFSKNRDSILLWSHYADAHKGICVEFDVEATEKDLVEVTYSKKKSKFDILAATSLILGLEFINKPFDSSNKRFNNKMMEPFYTKSAEWKYEQEVRYIFSLSVTERVYKENGKYYMRSPKISKIIIGCRVDTTSNNYKKLVEIANEHNIEIEYLTPSEDYYSLIKKGAN